MIALLARWTEKLAGGPPSDSPPLARVMAVGRQQQGDGDGYGDGDSDWDHDGERDEERDEVVVGYADEAEVGDGDREMFR